ncbi:MAG TPA: Na+/H+ antiporter NhaA [Usitatibacter sp.]|nr:Na+/H+ antiporter NhaA [Usitatibacter sp.]
MATTPIEDHALGGSDGVLTLLEYGSFHCRYCNAAHEVVANLRDRFGERLRYVFRHRPITDDAVALKAAEVAELAHQVRGEYWEAHDRMMKRGEALGEREIDEIAAQLALPTPEEAPQAWAAAREKVARDRESAARHEVRLAPTFLINGRRYEGAWDEVSLGEAMQGTLGHRIQAAALGFARWAPSTGLMLLAMTVLAMGLVNSQHGPAFEQFWTKPFVFAFGGASFGLPLRDWVNDGLLTIFFLVVGLEIKRELTVGRLASKRAAAFPIAAALGGMTLPALIYLAFAPAAFHHGWPIPTTTDTAFAVALIAVLGARVPVELRIFLTAAVIVDDLAAIAIVGAFFSGHVDPQFLAAAGATTAAMVVLNRSGVYRALPYALLGIVLWACLHAAGIHATLAGVVLAVATPTRPPGNFRALLAQAATVLQAEMRNRQDQLIRHGPSGPALRELDAIHARLESPADQLLRTVEPWSSYFVLPIFALANAGFALTAGMAGGHEALIAAIALGLVLGKPLGMLALAWLAVRLGIAAKPDAYTWRQLLGAGALAGIGFTMSLYIAAKAFPDPGVFAAAKLAVFVASIVAALLGTALLWKRSATVAPDST